MLRYIQKTAPEMVAAAGIVTTHAATILLPTPHLTADSLLEAPTPMIEPEIVWVVLTGIPKCAVAASTAAAAVSAEKPWNGWSLVILDAIVLTIRHPPKKVPSEIAA